MRLLTYEEKNEHVKKINQIYDRATRAKKKFMEDDLTLKKFTAIVKEVKKEEADYLKESGIILYFGRLFKVVK